MAIAQRDLGRLNSHQQSEDRVYTGLAALETNVAALLSGGTTVTSQVHHVAAVAAANVASLAAFTVAHDGLTMVAGERILLAAQTAPEENGIYVLGTVGAGTAPLTRATVWDATSEIKNNTLVVVTGGTIGANRIYQLTSTVVTIGTDAQNFARLYNSTQLAVQGTSSAGATLIGIYDNGSLITGTTVDAALTEHRALINTNTAAIFQKRTVTVAETDLTNAVNGASDTINIGAALPANAVVVAAEVNIATLFSGGGATAVKLDIGGTDIDAIAAQHDIFTGAATGALTPTPAGVHIAGKFSAEQLVATFTPDGAHALLNLTAGSLTITVWFHVLA